MLHPEDWPTATSDNTLLKGLPKTKVAATWAPWSVGAPAVRHYMRALRRQAADTVREALTTLPRLTSIHQRISPNNGWLAD